MSERTVEKIEKELAAVRGKLIKLHDNPHMIVESKENISDLLVAEDVLGCELLKLEADQLKKAAGQEYYTKRFDGVVPEEHLSRYDIYTAFMDGWDAAFKSVED